MTDFKPECTINLHVELRGKPAKFAWACSLSQERKGRVVLARRFLGLVTREQAELGALLFGLRQAQRFLQEKVEVAATFPLMDLTGGGSGTRRTAPELRALQGETARIWDSFRLKRIGRMGGEEALPLQEAAELAYQRKRKSGI